MHCSLLRQAVITLIFMPLNRQPSFPPPKFIDLEVDHTSVRHGQSTETIAGCPGKEIVFIPAAAPCVILWLIFSKSQWKIPFFRRQPSRTAMSGYTSWTKHTFFRFRRIDSRYCTNRGWGDWWRREPRHLGTKPSTCPPCIHLHPGPADGAVDAKGF